MLGTSACLHYYCMNVMRLFGTTPFNSHGQRDNDVHETRRGPFKEHPTRLFRKFALRR